LGLWWGGFGHAVGLLAEGIEFLWGGWWLWGRGVIEVAEAVGEVVGEGCGLVWGEVVGEDLLDAEGGDVVVEHGCLLVLLTVG
jgi:hypothetical protein